MSIRGIRKAFPKTIDFLKVKIYDTDLAYEHEIIERFEKSIYKTFENLYASKQELEKEIVELKDDMVAKDKKLDTLTDLLNTDNSLDRINSSFEQLSSMFLSKDFTSKLDHKALTWLRGLYGDKTIGKPTEGTIKKRKMRSKSKRKARDQGAAETKHLFGEILEILSSIISSTQSPKAEIGKLEYIKNRIMDELNKPSIGSKRNKNNGSYYSDIGSPVTMRQAHRRIMDDPTIQSEVSMSEFTCGNTGK